METLPQVTVNAFDILRIAPGLPGSLFEEMLRLQKEGASYAHLGGLLETATNKFLDGRVGFILDSELYAQLAAMGTENGIVVDRPELLREIANTMVGTPAPGGHSAYVEGNGEILRSDIFVKSRKYLVEAINNMLNVDGNETRKRGEERYTAFRNYVAESTKEKVEKGLNGQLSGEVNFYQLCKDISNDVIATNLLDGAMNNPQVINMLAEKYPEDFRKAHRNPFQVFVNMQNDLVSQATAFPKNKKVLDHAHEVIKSIFEEVFAAIDARVDKADRDYVASVKSMSDEECDKILKQVGIENPTAADRFKLKITLINQTLFASRDTTAGQMVWLTHHLAYQKVEGTSQTWFEFLKEKLKDMTSLEEMIDSPYLLAFIEETLRFSSIVALLIKQTVQDVEVLDSRGRSVKFNAGDILIAYPAIMDSNTGVFGPDAGEFNPFRWIDRQGNFSRVDVNTGRGHTSFGSPEHMGNIYACPGRKVAREEMMAYVASLLMNLASLNPTNNRPDKYPDGLSFNSKKVENLILHEDTDFEVGLELVEQ